MESQAILETIRAFVLSATRLQNIGDDREIFGEGGINSMFALRLVMFVEKTFRISIDDRDLDMANFRTIRALSAFVSRKQALRTMELKVQAGD